jgi:hypothetical protein
MHGRAAGQTSLESVVAVRPNDQQIVTIPYHFSDDFQEGGASQNSPAERYSDFAAEPEDFFQMTSGTLVPQILQRPVVIDGGAACSYFNHFEPALAGLSQGQRE